MVTVQQSTHHLPLDRVFMPRVCIHLWGVDTRHNFYKKIKKYLEKHLTPLFRGGYNNYVKKLVKS